MTYLPRRHVRLRRSALLASAALLVAAVLTTGCLGGNKKKSNTQAPLATPAASAAATNPLPGVPLTTPAATPAVRITTPVVPFTPAPPTSSPTPTPPPTPQVRTENGLQIVDQSFAATVIEPGGVRVRSAPAVDAGNVVGSVPEGAKVSVEGKVLNGAEAEPGKGTVWCIVGVKQYIYCGEGYVQPVGGTPAAGG